MEDIVAIGGFFITVITAFVMFGPVGRAVAASITRKHLPAPGAEVLDAVESLQQQVGELAERQDFTERLIAKGRERGALGSGGQA
jgi:hypothetical protein